MGQSLHHLLVDHQVLSEQLTLLSEVKSGVMENKPVFNEIFAMIKPKSLICWLFDQFIGGMLVYIMTNHYNYKIYLGFRHRMSQIIQNMTPQTTTLF